MYPGYGALRVAGIDGYYWASTALSRDNNTYYINFESASLYPVDSGGRWNGFTVGRSGSNLD